MTDSKDRLIELMHEFFGVDPMYYGVDADALADHLIAEGVIVPPCKVGDYVRVKGLTTLWQVDAIHYYREGLPQITITYGKISNTLAFSDPELFEKFTKEEAEAKLKEMKDNGNL